MVSMSEPVTPVSSHFSWALNFVDNYGDISSEDVRTVQDLRVALERARAQYQTRTRQKLQHASQVARIPDAEGWGFSFVRNHGRVDANELRTLQEYRTAMRFAHGKYFHDVGEKMKHVNEVLQMTREAGADQALQEALVNGPTNNVNTYNYAEPKKSKYENAEPFLNENYNPIYNHNSDANNKRSGVNSTYYGGYESK